MKSKRTINVDDLLQTESELLRRIAGEVVEGTGVEIGNHNSTTTGHRSGGSHNSHASAMPEKVIKKEEKK